jgi:hypothetical protein
MCVLGTNVTRMYVTNVMWFRTFLVEILAQKRVTKLCICDFYSCYER